ncbi:MAG: CoA transferase [Betaproteobacteria bacterium]|nr:CoA transferase [Betaproteobacteria bacterium]
MNALDGIRVIDVTHHISGPTCTMLLGDYGAEVIKIEPLDGEPLRAMNVVNTGGQRSTFLAVNRNKSSVALNLRSDTGRAIVRDMIRDADVFVENFRPGVAERLGLDYSALSAINSRLVYCSINGFGSEGPYRNRPALDLIVQAMGGVMSVTGESGGEPLPCGAPVADYLSGVQGLLGILLALQARQRTGRGQRVEASMLNAMVSLLSLRLQQFWATGTDLAPLGSKHPQNTPWGLFNAADLPFVVAVSTQPFWKRFCGAIDRADLEQNALYANNVDRSANRDALDAELSTWFATKPRDYWLQRLIKAGVPSGPVNSIAGLVNDEQVRQSGMLMNMTLQTGETVPIVGPPVRLSDTPASIRLPSPVMGADTRRVMKTLGYTDDEQRKLADEGVIKL